MLVICPASGTSVFSSLTGRDMDEDLVHKS